MANTIHFSERELNHMVEDFQKKSETESLFSHDLDQTFSGVKTVHVKILKTEDLQDYDKTKPVSTGSRYGETIELGDFEQTYTMKQDKSLSLSVDLGNNQDQLDMKKAAKVMSAHRDEKIIPYLDAYRIEKWAKEGGIHKAVAAPTTSNIVKTIMDLRNDMLDAGVPEDTTLLVPRRWMSTIMLADQFTGLEAMHGKILPKGVIGQLDGMNVKPLTSKYVPEDVYFMILYKKSVIGPMKINKFNVHKDPPGLSGDLIEFRMRHDAFVLGYRANGVAVACPASAISAAPTIGISGGTVTITGTGAKYTVDGSDPRFSEDAIAYTAPFSVPAGTTVKAFAMDSSKSFWSDVVERTYNG